MRDEKGFILPVTLMFSFFILLLFLHVVELYKMEAEFADQERQTYELDGLMQMAVMDIKSNVHYLPDTVSSTSDTIAYPTGTAYYSLQRLNQHAVKINVLCVSDSQFHYEAEFTLSIPELELIEWKEKY